MRNVFLFFFLSVVFRSFVVCRVDGVSTSFGMAAFNHTPSVEKLQLILTRSGNHLKEMKPVQT